MEAQQEAGDLMTDYREPTAEERARARIEADRRHEQRLRDLEELERRQRDIVNALPEFEPEPAPPEAIEHLREIARRHGE